MSQDQGASAKADRAATPSEPSQSSVVSGTAGIPCAEPTDDTVRAKVEAAVAAVDPDDYEPFVRNTVEAIYERLLGTVQDYLADNLEWNLRADFEYAAHRARSYEKDLTEIDKLVTPFGGRDERMRRINELLDRERELYALRASVANLYMAGRWSCDRPVDEVALWEAVRDTAGIAPGTATKSGVAA